MWNDDNIIQSKLLIRILVVAIVRYCEGGQQCAIKLVSDKLCVRRLDNVFAKLADVLSFLSEIQ